MTDHPITPPPGLFKQWEGMPRSLAFEAAYRAGADQELDACCEWAAEVDRDLDKELRAARRPKPPSLAEQALTLLDDASTRLDAPTRTPSVAPWSACETWRTSMANPTPLSPAAQAVLDAYYEVDTTEEAGLVAALRAAADQVAPEPSDLDKEMFSISALRLRWVIRDRFLAIAAELEGAGD